MGYAIVSNEEITYYYYFIKADYLRHEVNIYNWLCYPQQLKELFISLYYYAFDLKDIQNELFLHKSVKFTHEINVSAMIITYIYSILH